MHLQRAGNLGRLAMAALVAVVLAVAAASAARGAPSGHLAASAGAADSHPDGTGDANGASDVNGIDVGNDFVTGSFVIWVNFANRTSLGSMDDFGVYLDTDLNASTGAGGIDYVVGFTPPNNCLLLRWSGSAFAQVAAGTLKCDFIEKSARVEINPSDLGGVKTINFHVVTFSGDARGDDVPDSGYVSYTAGSGSVPLTIEQFAVRPTAPKAGKTLVAAMVVTRSDILQELDSGTVTCKLKAGTKNVPRSAGGFVGGLATCGWKVPNSAKGKTLRGTISVSFGGSQVTKSFAAKVR